MSVSLWAWREDRCEGDFCPGDCDFCSKAYDILASEESMDDARTKSIYEKLYLELGRTERED